MKKIFSSTLAVLLLSVGYAGAHDSVPGAPQVKPVAIVGATVHVVAGPIIENATLVFDKGRIIAIGQGVSVPTGAEVIDGRGKHVYPGLIDSCTDLGLTEFESVRATIDSREVGS